MSRESMLKRFGVAMVIAAVVFGCSGATTSIDPSPSELKPITTIRLGYFPNLTHAAALVGVQQGHFKTALKDLKLTVTPTIFNAGPDAVTALFGESLDCSYIGPNPAINAYVQSEGAAVRVVAGASSGGASLVVRDGIATPDDLRGKKIATPQLGNTQDVALRAWLADEGFATNVEGGGDVSVVPQANAEGLAAFVAGTIDGAWVPEPWVQEYVAQGAKVLLDERSLWPDGKFVTAQIICRTDFIQNYPEAVSALIRGHIAAIEAITADPAAAKASFSLALSAITGSAPKPEILDAAWDGLEFTYDPVAPSLVKSAEDAIRVGLLEKEKLDAAGGLPGDLYDLTILNEVLRDLGQPEVN